jgi:hypothetical protein
VAEGFKVDIVATKTRHDLRRQSTEVALTLPRTLEQASEPIASRAAQLAPKRSGLLASRMDIVRRGQRVYLHNPLEYAPVQEFGGTIEPHGGPVRIRAREYAQRAIEQQADAVLDHVDDELWRIARRTGWRS